MPLCADCASSANLGQAGPDKRTMSSAPQSGSLSGAVPVFQVFGLDEDPPAGSNWDSTASSLASRSYMAASATSVPTTQAFQPHQQPARFTTLSERDQRMVEAATNRVMTASAQGKKRKRQQPYILESATQSGALPSGTTTSAATAASYALAASAPALIAHYYDDSVPYYYPSAPSSAALAPTSTSATMASSGVRGKGKGKARASTGSMPTEAAANAKGKARASTGSSTSAKVSPKETSPEKRKATFRKAESGKIVDRVDRVLSQRMFCISREKVHELRETFCVSGSTGNLYTVAIQELPSCTCPDWAKGNICKHLLFIFLKVLGTSRKEHYHYQKALLPSELRVIFANSKPSPTALASATLINAYRAATGKEVSNPSGSSASAEDQQQKKRRIPEEGDLCLVCYEDLPPGKEDGLTFCEHSCGNALHNECFKQWSAQPAARGITGVKCCFCRAEFPRGGAAAAGPATITSGGYLNLASAAGVSQRRDTSTYYGGYHDYYDDLDDAHDEYLEEEMAELDELYGRGGAHRNTGRDRFRYDRRRYDFY